MKDQMIPKTFWSFIKWAYAPYKIWILLFLFFTGMTGFYGTINSYLIKTILDALNQLQDIQYTVFTIFLPLLLFIVNTETHTLLWRGIAYINLKLFPLIKSKITSEMMNYVHKHSYTFFQENLSGSIANKINNLSENVGRLYHPSAVVVRGIMQFTIANISMALVNPTFSFALFFWAFFFVYLSLHFSKKIRLLSDDFAKSYTNLSGKVVDSITNANNVRLFSRNSFEQSYLTTFLIDLKNKFRKKEIFLLKFTTVQGISVSVLLIFVLFYLVNLKSQNLISLGDFAFILTLTTFITDNIWWVTEQFDIINDAIGQCNQSLKSILTPLEIQDVPNAKELKVTKGEIKFSHVSFQYHKAKTLFQNNNIIIPPGQKLGLVGHSGSGKTTFVNLILRLFDVASGVITIDNQNIQEVTQESLRAHVGMIPQDPSLFHRSLMENIRYGRIDATDEEVIMAAKKAFAHEFITSLPEQYATLVGERGAKLSGGQRQRIAIARAILKNAPILILDEATSQLDSLTENKIQESLWNLMQDKTTLVIAHRLSTLLQMDRIVVFEEGKIIEDGSHEELLNKNGLYKTMWEAQVGGFLLDEQSDTAYMV